MKKLFYLATVLLMAACQQSAQKNAEQHRQQYAVDSTDRTNNFYDNEAVHSLKLNPVEVTGEIENPGQVDFDALPIHSVIVKEARLDENGNKFIGAYRYNGYSLLDILDLRKLNKANKDEFGPIIDLFVIVENESGEKAVFSWGEIFYPNHLHEILIATEVMRIVPSKTKELWPLPTDCKLVVKHDLITARNISVPVRIRIVSAGRSFEVDRNMEPMHADAIDVFVGGNKTKTLTHAPADVPTITYETIFYGRGRGIHSTTPFTGQMLKQVLNGQVDFTTKNLMNSYLIISAADGYRGVFSYSEIFNRNDQSEILLIDDPINIDGGRFRLFPACDFFSDRAIKAVSGIYFESVN